MLKRNSRVGAVVRSLGLGVLALAVLVGLMVSAQQQPQPAQPVTQIQIVPEKPTSNDEIKLELSGTFPFTCIPTEAKVTVEFNQVAVWATNTEESCLEAETKWDLSVPVGKKLEAGPYRVLVLFRMTKEPPDFLLGMARFDVAEKSASADQAGQAGAVPFTILPVIQTLDKSTAVPSGTFTAIINTAKSNTFRQVESAVPATVGVPVGDVITLASIVYINTTKSSTFRIAGCQASDAQIVGNCIPPFKLEITGPNPILTLLIEQTELPDLAASLGRLRVRRYTELEQVFCDVTGLATVRNIGNGPAGQVVAKTKREGINTTKSGLFRYGLSSEDGPMSIPIIETRLRPGNYQFEVEAESLSLKETDTKNNKATQVVQCR